MLLVWLAGYDMSNAVRASLGLSRLGSRFREVDIEMARAEMPAIDGEDTFEDTQYSLHVRRMNIAPAPPRF